MLPRQAAGDLARLFPTMTTLPGVTVMHHGLTWFEV